MTEATFPLEPLKKNNTFIPQLMSHNFYFLFIILTHNHKEIKDKLAYNEGSEKADGVIGSCTVRVERLDEVVGEGESDHCLAGWFHHQQGRPESAEK